MIVRIVRSWKWPNILQQTPGCSGVWDFFTFTEELEQKVDYCIVLNNLETGVFTPYPPNKVYRIVQEPPTEFLKEWHFNPSYSCKTFTCDSECSGEEYIRSHPMVPWHINRNYDFLSTVTIPDKTGKLSWITSTKNFLEGHKKRMGFLDTITNSISDLELVGTNIHHINNAEARKKNTEEQLSLGFKIVEDKWAGLAPYKYSLAIENFSGTDYWTEKIADCFLSWTLPIYYGCTNLEEYFPAESFVRIDINNPEEAAKIINQTIHSNTWEKSIKAISTARNLVLNEYQLFPSMTKFLKSL